MATEVSLKRHTGDVTFYNSYSEARAATRPGNVISIYKNLTEQIEMMDQVDIYISPGTVKNYSGDGPTITDNV